MAGARGPAALAEGAGAVAGGADAAARAVDRVTDAGDGAMAVAGGNRIGTGDVGGTIASLACGKMRSLTNELSDEIALSALARTTPAPSKYPENCSPMATKPCKA